jgi:hypothetical protein
MYKDLIIYTRGAGGTICTLYDGSKSGVQPVSTINSYIAPGTNTQTLTLYYTYTKSTTQVQDQGGVFNFKIQFELKQL